MNETVEKILNTIVKVIIWIISNLGGSSSASTSNKK